jgi:hypothetical protein
MRLLNLNQARWHANPHSKKLIIITLRRSRYGVCRLVVLAAKRSPVSKTYEAGNEFDFARPPAEADEPKLHVGVVNRLCDGEKDSPAFTAR